MMPTGPTKCHSAHWVWLYWDSKSDLPLKASRGKLLLESEATTFLANWQPPLFFVHSIGKSILELCVTNFLSTDSHP